MSQDFLTRQMPKVNSRRESPAKVEALLVLTRQAITLNRAKGEEPPPSWHLLCELVETGHATMTGPHLEGDVRSYQFFITNAGRAEVRSHGYSTKRA